MTITVKDLYQYNPNFDPAKIKWLTGKSNPEKTNKIILANVEGLNDKKFSIFVAEEEGEPFVNSLTDDNMRAQVAYAAGIENVKNDYNTAKSANNQNPATNISMDTGIYGKKLNIWG